MDLVSNIHQGLPLPRDVPQGSEALVKGDYLYYHYGCDGEDDRGWGCGYRTLQTLCSWVRCQKAKSESRAQEAMPVPPLQEIQELLVGMGDKPQSFAGSRSWIGSVEVGLIVDRLYDVPCKILHVGSGQDLQKHADQLEQHFKELGSPIMMGGDSDASSKGVLGICRGDETYLLILDPHYYGKKPTQATLMERKMLCWCPLRMFMANSFYNLCMPQYRMN